MANINLVIASVSTIIISYILGSLNFAIITTKKTNKDIRSMGSGNAGFTNVLRSVGKLPAILTILGDFAKCLISIFAGKLIFSYFLVPNANPEVILYGSYLAGISCFLGHIYPCFFKFKGGKGVVTAAAIATMTNFKLFLIAISVFLVCLAISKIVSLSSISAVLTFVICFFAFNYIGFTKNICSSSYLIVSTTYFTAIFLIVLYCHKSNIKNLLNGTEKKISIKKN